MNERTTISMGVAIIDDDTTSATRKAGRRSRAATISGTQDNDFFFFPCSTNELVEQKKKFLIFLRILLKYLQRRDRARHAEVKAVLREFANFMSRRSSLSPHSRQNEGCSLLKMYSLVKSLVSETQWNDALVVLRMFLIQRRCRASHAGNARSMNRCAMISSDGS